MADTSVDGGELADREGPAVQRGAEHNGAAHGVHLRTRNHAKTENFSPSPESTRQQAATRERTPSNSESSARSGNAAQQAQNGHHRGNNEEKSKFRRKKTRKETNEKATHGEVAQQLVSVRPRHGVHPSCHARAVRVHRLAVELSVKHITSQLSDFRTTSGAGALGSAAAESKQRAGQWHEQANGTAHTRGRDQAKLG